MVSPGLGALLAEDQLTRELGLTGVLVVEVPPGSAAAKAGFQPTRREAGGRVRLGDLTVAIDGKKVASVNDLYLILEQYGVGDTVHVTVQRGGRVHQLRATLEAVG